MRFVYAANILVAGIVGALALFAPSLAQRVVFSGTATPSATMGVTGAVWCAIAVLSVGGLVWPERMAPVLVIQLIYKSLWLLAFALPAWRSGGAQAVPGGVAVFFAVWVVVLPFVIPWTRLFGSP